MPRRIEVTRQRIGTTYRWNSLVVTLGLLSGCATQLQVGSDYDRTATFRDYHTFAVMRREHSGLENPLNPLVVARVEDASRSAWRVISPCWKVAGCAAETSPTGRSTISGPRFSQSTLAWAWRRAS